MKHDISALLDEELGEDEANRAIDALRRDKGLQEAWNTYHLIGDTCCAVPRNTPRTSPSR